MPHPEIEGPHGQCSANCRQPPQRPPPHRPQNCRRQSPLLAQRPQTQPLRLRRSPLRRRRRGPGRPDRGLPRNLRSRRRSRCKPRPPARSHSTATQQGRRPSKPSSSTAASPVQPATARTPSAPWAGRSENRSAHSPSSPAGNPASTVHSQDTPSAVPPAPKSDGTNPIAAALKDFPSLGRSMNGPRIGWRPASQTIARRQAWRLAPRSLAGKKFRRSGGHGWFAGSLRGGQVARKHRQRPRQRLDVRTLFDRDFLLDPAAQRNVAEVDALL